MDSLHFDAYTSYSDSSAPRTPSPHHMHFATDAGYKHDLDPSIEPRIYTPDDQQLDPTQYWPQQTNTLPYNPRGSLLQELYDHDLAEQQQQHQHQHQQQHALPYHPQEQQQQQQPQQDQWQRHQDYTLIRRATFPYVRHDRDDVLPLQHYPSFYPQQGSPYSEYEDHAPIKLEDSVPVMVPSQHQQQQQFYPRPPSSGSCHPLSMSYLSPHTGLPVQHTDDAASKETQYLRRRCFNCHTTEPPSWRRSTLNPGKIVCNKCGLYERTHLRPRPLRFDELRAGNKARKQSQSGGKAGAVSPKQKLSLIKKEPREFGGLVRRSSVSSASSVHSGSGASDWDDNVSVYSNGSAPPTSFNSPNPSPFPLRDSQSPPHDGGIRLPNAPLSDIASIQPAPRKAHTAPYFSPPQEYYRPQEEWQPQSQSPASQSSLLPELAPPVEALELAVA